MASNQREKIVYDTLCDLYGEDAINFFTNVYGMRICADNAVYNALVESGALCENAMENTDEEEWEFLI